MFTKQIQINQYSCEKCDQIFDKSDDCEKHESICTFDYLNSLIKHDGKYTEKLEYLDTFRFYRMCSRKAHESKRHIWLNVNRQFTIGNDDTQFYTNNNWCQKMALDMWQWQNDITFRKYFEYDPTGKCDNIINIDSGSLKKCKLIITFNDNEKITWGGKDDNNLDANYNFELTADIKVTMIELIDINRINPEFIKFEISGDKCLTRCPHRKKEIYVESNACANNCAHYVINASDYSANDLKIKCSYLASRRNQ